MNPNEQLFAQATCGSEARLLRVARTSSFSSRTLSDTARGKERSAGEIALFFVVFFPFSYFHEVIVDNFLLYIDALIRLLIFVYFLAIIFSPAVPASREFLVSLNYERYIFHGHIIYVYL